MAGCLALAPGANAALTKTATGPGGPITLGVSSNITFTVSNFPGKVTDVNVGINGLSHEYPEDIEAQLIAPNGTAVNVLSDAGDSTPVSGIGLLFDDSAPSKLDSATLNPMGMHPMVAGTFQPSAYSWTDPMDDPNGDPFGPGTSPLLAGLNGSGANGAWVLKVTDDYANDDGSFAGTTLTLSTDFKPKKCKKKKGKKGAVAAKKKCKKKGKKTIVSSRSVS